MAHTYTFSANALNTDLFFGKTAANSTNSDAVWNPSAVTYDPNSTDRYIADSVDVYYDQSSGSWQQTNRRFWICGAYFGDAETMAHLASLEYNQITSIKLTFSVSEVSYGWEQRFQCDTALNAVGSNFAHVHSSPKEFLGDSVRSGTNITLDMTSYGVPSSGGWLIHYSAWTYMSITSAITLTVVTTENYSLSTSAGTGSSITVNRTASPRGGATGIITNGAAVYYGDILKITFTPSENYSITTHTVNGSTFTSGGSHTASGNVAVVATATPLKSDIGASDANIGSTSTVTVTRYNTDYTHTVTYALGTATGTIVTKSSNTSIAWTVPTAFYTEIPNAQTGTCILTCETFNGDTSLGSTTCTLTVTAPENTCKPTVVGTVVDTNSTTVALTGSSSILVRGRSTAVCTITATANNSATIANKYINDVAPTDNVRTISNVTTTNFVFKATDSRGYTTTATVTPTMIAYVNLTFNPTLFRNTPTSGEAYVTFSGDYFRGSFGAYNNTLTIQYRYKLTSSATWSSWATIPAASIAYNTAGYSSASNVLLGSNFDYRYDYDFEFRAYDGAGGYTLTTIQKPTTLRRGIPVFDWGENDFTFHVPIKIGSTQLTEAQLQALLAMLT